MGRNKKKNKLQGDQASASATPTNGSENTEGALPFFLADDAHIVEVNAAPAEKREWF